MSQRVTLPYWSFNWLLYCFGVLASEDMAAFEPQQTHHIQADEYLRRRQASNGCPSGYYLENGRCYLRDRGLTGGQIGGIVVGAVAGFLLLLTAVWHRKRISRFMKRSNGSRKPTNKEGDGSTGDTEATELDGGNVGAGRVAELSPQERPHMLEEWGRHGGRGHELPGSYEAHGTSELDGASVSRT